MDHAPLIRHERAERHLHIDTTNLIEFKDEEKEDVRTVRRSQLLQQANAAIKEKEKKSRSDRARRGGQFDRAVDVLHESVESRLIEMVAKGESQEVIRLYTFRWTRSAIRARSEVDDSMLEDKDVWREVISRYYSDPGKTTSRVIMVGDGSKVFLSVEKEGSVKRWFNTTCVSYHGGLHTAWRWLQLCCC